MKKLFILFILLFSHLCVADIRKDELLLEQIPVIEKQKFSNDAEKMQTICRKTNSKKIIERSTKILSNEQIIKKQFENKKREILNTMNELKYKKIDRDISNKINELTSEIESLQYFVLTGEKKKRDFYFSVSGGKTHSSNSNEVISGVDAIADIIDHTIMILNGITTSAMFNTAYGIMNQFTNATIDFQSFGSGALGRYVGSNGRIELEVIDFGMRIKERNRARQASLLAMMFNLYYNPTIKNTLFDSYVGIGLGAMNLKYAIKKDDPNINLQSFVYQAKLGVAYSFIPELKISLGYRVFNIYIPLVDSVNTHNFEVGLIFNF